MRSLDGVLHRLDRLQQGRRLLAFAFAVQKKYGEDRCGSLAALVAYYGLLSILPLLLAVFTIAAYVLGRHQAALRSVDLHLGSYPVIGTAITQLEGHRLHGSPVAVAVGLIGLLWGATGLAETLQFAMAEVWRVPGKDRRGFPARMARGLLWYCAFGVGFVTSTFVASLGPLLRWPGGSAVSSLASLSINIALFSMSFRILSPGHVSLRKLLPGALGAGLAWTALTGVGVGLTTRLAHVNPLYGSFAAVLSVIAFLYLAARITLYAVQADAVRALRLWPRSLKTPPFTVADKQALIDLARQEARVDHVTVRVEFDREEQPTREDSGKLPAKPGAWWNR